MASVTKIYTHERLGEVTLVRSSRARRITLTVRPGGEVRLAYPWFVAQRRAVEFLCARAEWVEERRRRLMARRPPKPPYFELPYSTRSHTLRYRPAAVGRVSATISDCEIVVTHPASADYRSEEVAAVTRRAIIEALRSEAKALLPARVAELSRRTGLTCRSVTVRATVSKWGSCSGRNDLSLSLYLMLLPDELIDFVLLHELCHTVHHNHSAQFHALLDTLLGGREKELSRALRSAARENESYRRLRH